MPTTPTASAKFLRMSKYCWKLKLLGFRMTTTAPAIAAMATRTAVMIVAQGIESFRNFTTAPFTERRAATLLSD
jgi:hypothetical protein